MMQRYGYPPVPVPSSSGTGPPKRKRVTRACDKCHRNGSKCSRNEGEDRCVRCIELGIPCTFDRPVKRRGPPARRAPVDSLDSPASSSQFDVSKPPTVPRSRSSQPSLPDLQGQARTPSDLSMRPTSTVSTPPQYTGASASFWRYDDLLDPATVHALADIYYRTLYPLRPFLHWPSMMADISAGRYRSNWGVFVVTVSMCAFAAGKLADGGVPDPVSRAVQGRGEFLWNECYNAALGAVRRDRDVNPSDGTDVLPLLKARSLLACSCMLRGNLNSALEHYGAYSIVAAQAGFHDEANWPADITEIQKQERRRLFWYAYQVDQYNSTCFGLVPRHREARAHVQYPAEVEDDDISDVDVSPKLGHVSFMRGWNVCSDLYRVLEHVYDNLRADPPADSESQPGDTVTRFLARGSRVDSHAALRLVERLLSDLPPELRRVTEMTGDVGRDRLGFITTNIIITSQTLKMLLALSDNWSVHQRCAIASELLDELSTLPTAYLKASSVTTLQHLAHVGHLLSGVIDGPLPTWTYLQVRNILFVLSEFIATLETAHSTTPDLATKLREQIRRIDENMSSQGEGNGSLGASLVRSIQAQTAPTTTSNTGPAAPAAQPEARTVPSREVGMSDHKSLDSALGLSNENLISVDDALAPLPSTEDALIPPDVALSALQLGSGPDLGPFSALGFAASQGMFDSFGGQPVDDALLGEFLRHWPAQGVLGDSADGMSGWASGSGM